MGYIYANVSQYLVSSYGGPNGDTSSAHGFAGADAVIRLVMASESAFLFFYREGMTLPENRRITYSGGRSAYYVSYRWSQFTSVIDLLRNEKPIQFFFRDGDRQAYISTSAEPVGEAE
jgi:hypothetical protein